MRQTCPYNDQPSTALWREAVSQVSVDTVNPTVPAPFRIERDTRVASAGSCFAQHIRDQVARRGYNYLVTELGPSHLDDEERADLNYGVFPARFGNIYTTRQLWQTFERCHGRFDPAETHWVEENRFHDPFRPHVEPGGFASLDELLADRERHFAATRALFANVEVFVFTLGLTEAWRSRLDGAVFPVCPGCSVGAFDPDRHEFVNFSVGETAEALFSFIDGLASVNPTARVILTVSPVPLAATMSKNHVVEATVYSKSVLRVAAEMARERYSHVCYFPSYEIITNTGRAREFFAGDRRSVTPAGVKRVMDLFFQRFAGEREDVPTSDAEAPRPSATVSDRTVKIVCDEDTALAGLRQRSL